VSVLRSTLLGLSRNHWLGKRLPNSAAGRRAARKFMPGERLEVGADVLILAIWNARRKVRRRAQPKAAAAEAGP